MENDERLQVALAAANNIGTWDWDVVSGLVKADARVCEFYGVDPKLGADGAPASEFERRIHPDDLQMFHRTIIGALRDGAAFTADYRVLQPDGSARWVSAQGRCTQDQDNRTFRCEGVALDITSRKLLDSALRESEQRFRLIAENAPVMLWMGDGVGKCMYLNRAQREFWGVAEERVGAFDWNDMLHPDDREALFTPFARAMQEHASFQVEARFRRAADGTYRIINTQGHPRFGPFGDFLGMIGVNVDVTETRQAVVALRAETRRLEILNRTGAAVAAEVSIEKIVQIIVEACTELTGAQFGAFFYNVIDDKGESYMLYALAGAPREAF